MQSRVTEPLNMAVLKTADLVDVNMVRCAVRSRASRIMESTVGICSPSFEACGFLQAGLEQSCLFKVLTPM